jgi:hypothetical protein
VHAPNLWSSAWTCDLHGEVCPLQPVVQPHAEVLHDVVRRSAVPVWLPWPLPRGWLLTGIAHAGDERTGARAVAVACSGPAPLGGMGELVLVAEEPGVGLGAHLAGLEGPDPGTFDATAPPHAKVHAAGHPTPLWLVDCPDDRAVYVGEAMALWLWAVLWPASAGHLFVEELLLTDLRDVPPDLELPYGALSPRLAV